VAAVAGATGAIFESERAAVEGAATAEAWERGDAASFESST
jgi:hypothetical protein